MKEKEKYRCWIEQINQCVVEVEAESKGEAIMKAYKKWRRDYAHARVSYMEKIVK